MVFIFVNDEIGYNKKMNKFKNTILLLNFNFSEDLINLHLWADLYSSFFKKVIVYSDFPKHTSYPNVNYVETQKGFFTYNIFTHFYENYMEDIKNSDGIFYTQDDCVFNINSIKNFDLNSCYGPPGLAKSKIPTTNTIGIRDINQDYRDWSVWSSTNGLTALNNALKLLDIKKISYGFSDFFYLPRRMWTSNFIDFLKISYKTELFLEIAIPTILVNMEGGGGIYTIYPHKILWGTDREFSNKKLIEWIEDGISVIHPVKLRSNPDLKKGLKFLMSRSV